MKKKLLPYSPDWDLASIPLGAIPEEVLKRHWASRNSGNRVNPSGGRNGGPPTTIYITAFGETHTVAEWADLREIKPSTLRMRLLNGDKGEHLLRPAATPKSEAPKKSPKAARRGKI